MTDIRSNCEPTRLWVAPRRSGEGNAWRNGMGIGLFELISTLAVKLQRHFEVVKAEVINVVPSTLLPATREVSFEWNEIDL